jgi:phosphoenolpyruvate synthase/pyruvate phosphate dikinase
MMNTLNDRMTSMSSKCITWLADFIDEDLGTLGRLVDHKLPVPYGFVISGRTLHERMQRTNIHDAIRDILELVSPHNDAERDHARREISKLLRESVSTALFRREIFLAYEKLVEREYHYYGRILTNIHKIAHVIRHVYRPVTVRLSCAEDASFEVLSCGESSVLQGIFDVWAGWYARDPRLKRWAKPLPHILAQRVTNGEKSGTIETVNTTHNRRDQMVIFANFGAVPQEACADVYVVNKTPFKLHAQHIATKTSKQILHGVRYRRVAIHEANGEVSSLTNEEMLELVKRAREAEKFLYFPQKIFWTFEKGRLFFCSAKVVG